MTSFVDQCTLYAVAGSGGHGCASIHREKFKPLGGPDGGNGGRGGDITLVASTDAASLMDIAQRPHRRAANGQPGQGGHRNGAQADDIVIAVPPGTVVTDESGETIADLIYPGDECVVARGGRGGLGNAALASRRRKAPTFALLGEPGEERTVTLELKVLADVGLIGFPSAGKSSLVSVLSAAKPKIADYPFTTLTPQLGVVSAAGHTFTVADVPGLIPGASEGKGLGLEFLRHIDRCVVLAHVIDCATFEPLRDPISDFDAIEAELAAYGILADRPRIVILNKMDIPDAVELADMIEPEFHARGLRTFRVSTVTHEGLKELTFALATLVAEHRQPVEERQRIVIRPAAVNDAGFAVKALAEGAFRITGDKPTRWVRQTDFSNEAAVAYLTERLAKLGVDDALRDRGAIPGATVYIGPVDNAVVFDWYPNEEADDSDI